MRLRTSSQQQQRKSATPAAASVTAPSPTPPPPSAPNSSEIVVELKEAKSEPKEEERSSSLVPQPPLKTQQKTTTTTTVCYCNGQRKLGNLEVHCAGCKCWFHQNCFRNLDNFGGLPFMVSYQFLCQNCAPEGKEKWTIRSTSYSSMAVMTMANMTLAYRIKQCGGSAAEVPAIVERNPYFSVDQEIVKYMEDNWEYLSTTPKRQKKTWHHTILKILQKETDLFEQEPQNEGSFALKERDLLRIGPMHESVIQLFKRSRDAVEREANALQIGEQQLMSTLVGGGQQFSEGPKTRGASKRKAAAALGPSPGPGESTTATEGSPKSGGGASAGGGAATGGGGAAGSAAKKAKTSEFATVQIDALSGATVDFPFNREGYRYYLVEKDPNIPNREQFDTEEVSNTRAVQIPSHIYRLVIPPAVTLSPNDRANQLLLDLNNLNVAVGHEGYGMARATHSVSHGCWYFEMEFLSQPGDSHVRVGWAQSSAVLQACVGYTKASYSWRSKRGTRFHDGYGWHYHPNGYRQGDVVGCLIQLPPLDDYYAGHGLSEVLPASKKDCDLIKFKQTCFFEEKEETQLLVQRLKPLPGSRIEFFLNGHSCGTAFRDIYAGHYFPAVSLFQSARVRLNFGPAFRRPPACVRTGEARPMSQRPEQMQAEQAVADLTFMVANQEELEAKNANYINAILAKESAQQQAQAQQQQQQQSKAAPTPKDDGKY